MAVGEQRLRSRSPGFHALAALIVLADWRYAVPALPSLVALSGLTFEDAIRRFSGAPLNRGAQADLPAGDSS